MEPKEFLPFPPPVGEQSTFIPSAPPEPPFYLAPEENVLISPPQLATGRPYAMTRHHPVTTPFSFPSPRIAQASNAMAADFVPMSIAEPLFEAQWPVLTLPHTIPTSSSASVALRTDPPAAPEPVPVSEPPVPFSEPGAESGWPLLPLPPLRRLFVDGPTDKAHHRNMGDPYADYRVSPSDGDASPEEAMLAIPTPAAAAAAAVVVSSSHRKTRKYPCLVPLIVVCCCGVFGATMYVNNCPAMRDDCILPFLGRMSFEPLKGNPFLGPWSGTLVRMGALDPSRMRKHEREKFRLLTYFWLHAGVLHLLINMLGLVFIGIRLERDFGPWRTALVYLLSAAGGSLMSGLLLYNNISVGASGALFGLLGANLAELIINWGIYERRCSTLALLVFMVFLNLLIGLSPNVDNFSHIGGFFSGLLLGFVLLVKPQYGYINPSSLGPEFHDIRLVPLSPKRKHNCCQTLLRSAALLVLVAGFGAALALVFLNVDGNKECHWCRYMSCVDTVMWTCDQHPGVVTCNATETKQGFIFGCDNGQTKQISVQNLSSSELSHLCYRICR
ncbi:hypothetical protein CBR_g51123 [Chara braunii]|uniref:RHOMBOID-like protein n=1 Tax=Chara braunii TaxID=69332 RepID=A0A388K672_CHABU|nr:hypothetical protein CBR_g51123 [Chara braunii]|eukprot:GBG65529.1 hypothetical protein CBR_g51123 [Chara braunii]